MQGPGGVGAGKGRMEESISTGLGVKHGAAQLKPASAGAIRAATRLHDCADWGSDEVKQYLRDEWIAITAATIDQEMPYASLLEACKVALRGTDATYEMVGHTKEGQQATAQPRNYLRAAIAKAEGGAA